MLFLPQCWFVFLLVTFEACIAFPSPNNADNVHVISASIFARYTGMRRRWHGEDLDRRSDGSSPPQNKQPAQHTVYPAQGKISSNGVAGFSPLLNQSLVNSANSSPSFRDKSSQLETNSSSLFKNKHPELHANASSSAQDKLSRLGANSSFPYRNKSPQLGSVALSLDQSELSLLSHCSLKNASNSTSRYPNVQPRGKIAKLGVGKPSLLTNGSFNITKKWDGFGKQKRYDRAAKSLQNPDGLTPADLASWPGTSRLPVPPRGHNEEWNACWIRGKLAWNALPYAQASLQDNRLVNIDRWRSECLDGAPRPPSSVCANNGLLQKIDDVDNHAPSYEPELCDSTYWDWIFEHKDRDGRRTGFWSSGYISPRAKSIVSDFWNDDRVDYEKFRRVRAPNSWADIIIRTWIQLCALERQSFNSLKYITITGSSFGIEIDQVLRDMRNHDSLTNQRSLVDGSTPMSTYTANDDNFYALLGTRRGIGAFELLYNYPQLFSTRMPDGSQKVKTIASVRISGSSAEVPYRAQGQPYGDIHYGWPFAFTFRDVDFGAGDQGLESDASSRSSGVDASGIQTPPNAEDGSNTGNDPNREVGPIFSVASTPGGSSNGRASSSPPISSISEPPPSLESTEDTDDDDDDDNGG